MSPARVREAAGGGHDGTTPAELAATGGTGRSLAAGSVLTRVARRRGSR
ncbi:hypothetical protein [Kitasatospora brasiliensis]|nr:hypothetical protein [Kitasatospora sp. K002]